MKKTALFAATLALISAQPAHAYDEPVVVFGLGYANIFQNDDEDIGLRAEYRSERIEPKYVLNADHVSYFVGVDAYLDFSAYAYGGFLYDWKVADNWYVIPSLAAGLYHEGGGRDLGGMIEFRSQIEVDYEMQDKSRIGLSLNHVSNASIYDNNPGTEHIFLNYTKPIGAGL
ncbi:MAG: acyloxyacyl hydrolase [Alphaproteobacteria bacterium CG11_big_fil_rev_8_21_14_0_20_44_7]|nr:MAG: acyloxyacyl hydrolase [Alphaproteobacteria bacterium CG11_big_fil_rev_8_21_14_0_20_44_7]